MAANFCSGFRKCIMVLLTLLSHPLVLAGLVATLDTIRTFPTVGIYKLTVRFEWIDLIDLEKIYPYPIFQEIGYEISTFYSHINFFHVFLTFSLYLLLYQ